jgi:aminoglycoside phosphotransferase (APT) family kinase protein
MTPAERFRRDPQLEPGVEWMHGVLAPILKASAHTDRVSAVPLAGGVSSDIYRVDAGGSTLCVKRALGKLKVAADWRVPVARNRTEVAWLKVAARIAPQAVPAILGEDPAAGAFAMEWLPPERFPVWKHLLRDGVIVRRTAEQVGEILGRLHRASAKDSDLPRTFATDAAFHAIRLEPYLLATARAHPDLAQRLAALAERTANTRRALVHGDMSPKNLLIGENGPVIVDAECAWWGDPAFDLAFVLNHLLLKGAWRPHWRADYVDLYRALVDAYRPNVDWEPWADLEHRTATLLPALMLARIDGKSPVEYLVDDTARDAVRRFARALLTEGDGSIASIALRWNR